MRCASASTTLPTCSCSSAIVPACAVAALALARPDSPEVRAYLAVTLAFAAGFVGEVGLFASRYVGRLAERDLLGLAPLFFLGLCLWLDRGAPRRRASSYVVAFAAAALVLALPLGRLVHKAALPDAFTLIPVWQLGSYDVVVWSFAAVAVLAFASAAATACSSAIPVALALVFVVMSISVSQYVAKEASLLEDRVLRRVRPRVGRRCGAGRRRLLLRRRALLERGLVARLLEPEDPQGLRAREGAARAGTDAAATGRAVPARRARPGLARLGRRRDADVHVPGGPVATITQVGLGQNGLTLWRSGSPLRLQTTLASACRAAATSTGLRR